MAALASRKTIDQIAIHLSFGDTTGKPINVTANATNVMICWTTIVNDNVGSLSTDLISTPPSALSCMF
jgi:hypothetical protein